MHRLDDELIRLDAQLKSTDSAAEREQINEQIAKRENQLAPVYLQIAHEFADLHDRAGRMKAKGVISDALSWKRYVLGRRLIPKYCVLSHALLFPQFSKVLLLEGKETNLGARCSKRAPGGQHVPVVVGDGVSGQVRMSS